MFFNEKQLKNSKVEHDKVDGVDVPDPFKVVVVHRES